MISSHYLYVVLQENANLNCQDRSEVFKGDLIAGTTPGSRAAITLQLDPRVDPEIYFIPELSKLSGNVQKITADVKPSQCVTGGSINCLQKAILTGVRVSDIEEAQKEYSTGETDQIGYYTATAMKKVAEKSAQFRDCFEAQLDPALIQHGKEAGGLAPSVMAPAQPSPRSEKPDALLETAPGRTGTIPPPSCASIAEAEDVGDDDLTVSSIARQGDGSCCGGGGDGESAPRGKHLSQPSADTDVPQLAEAPAEVETTAAPTDEDAVVVAAEAAEAAVLATAAKSRRVGAPGPREATVDPSTARGGRRSAPQLAVANTLRVCEAKEVNGGWRAAS